MGIGTSQFQEREIEGDSASFMTNLFSSMPIDPLISHSNKSSHLMIDIYIMPIEMLKYD
jgi:hypothetical protein